MILITGINGFVGSHIARLLVARGERVRGLVRKTSDLSNLSDLLSSPRKRGSNSNDMDSRLRGNDSIELYEGDICRRESLRKAFEDIDICYHTAALVKAGHFSKEDYFSANLRGTMNVCAEAMRAGVKKFIYTSTCETLRANPPSPPFFKGGVGGLLITEDIHSSYHNMVGDYGRSKFLAEEHVRTCVANGLPAVIVNPSAVVGPGDVNLTPPHAMILAYCKGKIPFYFETGFNIVDVRDIADGHLLACEKGHIGERYILGNNNIMLSQLFALLSSIKKKFIFSTRSKNKFSFFPIKLPFKFIYAITKLAPIDPSWKEKVKASERPFFLDSTKAKNELGWTPKFELQTTLKDALDWLCNH